MTSESGFIQPEHFSHDWQNISLLQTRRDNIIYIGERYGRRFILKTLRPELAELTEYRLLQEKEFHLGIALSHPNIATTFSIEDVTNIGRCIIQEKIEGQTLSDWLLLRPFARERQRVWSQLMSALAYLHANQRVHHDLKSSNILITCNGNNVKLIDFGLSDSDDSTTPVEQDAKDDIRKLAPLIRTIFPRRYPFIARHCEQGDYPNIEAVQRAWQRRQLLWRLLPIILSLVLLLIATAFFYIAYHERYAEQRRQQEMMTCVNEAFFNHEQELRTVVMESATYREAMTSITDVTHDGWLVRDSIIALLSENDPMRIVVFDLWAQRDAVLQTELIQQMQSKPLQ